MTYSKKEFARDLKAQLDQGYNPKRIGSWAHKMYLAYCGTIDKKLEDLMIDLFFLEEGPEFEYTQEKMTFLVTKLINDECLYNCRVCGLNQGFEPWENNGERPTHAICPCCGADFGYDDETPLATKKYRVEWISHGAQWFCPDEKPNTWSLEEQLKNIPKDFQ